MDLTTLLPGLKPASSEYYWSLVVEPGWAQAGIWQIKEGKADVVSVSPIAPWQNDDEIIGACDTVLSSAIQNLPEDVKEPTKTIFGVPSPWVEGGQIKSEYLDKIRKVCTELSLDPAGFVVLPEAIAHYYKSEEGAPLNAIVLGQGTDSLEVAVFRLGNLMGTQTIARSVSITDDVIEGLTRFMTAEPLPSRIIIYDGKEGELENTRQALLSTSWEGIDKIKFLHTPKVEILETNKKVIATSLAGASEISGVSEIVNVKTTAKEEITPEELGFALGSDVQPQLPPQPVAAVKKPKINIKLPKMHFTPKPFLTGGFILAGLLVLLVLGYVFLPKAAVTIYVNPQKINEKTDLTVSLTGSTNPASGIVAGQLVSDAENGQKTKSATGTKLVGNKAKGMVNIQNGTDTDLNLTAQTVLVSSGNLQFILDNSASVSAALSPTSPGSAQVAVTAGDIGADYNLAKDEIFKVGNYPKAEVDAVSVTEFSGGSSKQILTVSADDLKSLETDLKAELTDKAQQSLTAKVADGSLLIPASVIATSSSEVYSGRVGDEAVTVGLNMGLKVSEVEIIRADLVQVAQTLLSGKLPAGYKFDGNNLTTNFSAKDVKGGKYTFGVVFTANLLPQIKPDEIIKTIAGQTLDQAQKYLTSIPGYVRANIGLSPRIYLTVFHRLPLFTKNISLEITAQP